MKGKVIRFIDNLDREKTGRVLFGIGLIGFMTSGCCLDSKAWYLALMGVIMSVGVCYAGYQMADLQQAFRWESRKTRERKEANREATYLRWIRSTNVTK